MNCYDDDNTQIAKNIANLGVAQLNDLYKQEGATVPIPEDPVQLFCYYPTVMGGHVKVAQQMCEELPDTIGEADQQRSAPLSQGCFVATAVFSDPDKAPVRILRRYRDQRLSQTPAGRVLVGLYYSVGPHLAEIVARHKRLRGLLRCALVRIARAASRLVPRR